MKKPTSLSLFPLGSNMYSRLAVALFASATLVAGHGIVPEVVIDGKWYIGTKARPQMSSFQNWDSPENKNSPVRGIPHDTGFVKYQEVTSNMDIACSSAGYKGTPIVAPIKAGGQIKIRWAGDKGPSGLEWPHPEGPELTYLAPCTNNDCTTFNPKDAKFFKIQEAGLDTTKEPIQSWIDHRPWGDGLWIQNKQMLEGSWFTVSIPNDIKSGPYLLRHELISLHGAHSRTEGAQYYPVCIQINVTGGGNAQPAGIPATQLYTVDDGIVDIYTPFPKGIKSYKIPGPALYKAGNVQNPAPATTSSPSTTKAAPSTTKPVTTVVPTTKPATGKPVKACKPKRGKRSVADETKELYARALVGARARRAHAAQVERSF
ncbi:hypothetical protein FRC10_004154 [Ceratobasidium sp. 414]|nr:hypothetical protein FRC10_004154 [Ceratobasidium sp. 414]